MENKAFTQGLLVGEKGVGKTFAMDVSARLMAFHINKISSNYYANPNLSLAQPPPSLCSTMHINKISSNYYANPNLSVAQPPPQSMFNFPHSQNLFKLLCQPQSQCSPTPTSVYGQPYTLIKFLQFIMPTPISV